MRRETLSDEIILPAGYTRLEYIKSTGTQYINTNATVGTGKYEISIDFYVDSYTSGSVPFGAGSPNDSQWIGNPYFNSNNLFELYIGNRTYFGRGLFSAGEMSHIDLYVDVNNNTFDYTFTQTSNESHLKSTLGFGGSIYQNTLILFAFHRGTSVTSYTKMRCYDCKITLNDVLSRHFIPALRDFDSKPGLYDIVNDVFYTNAGSGEFQYGTL